MKKQKREVDLVVISDVHLGTYGCRAKELLKYLKSIKPNKVILNGDIIDIWQFKKRYWPKAHMKVVKHIIGLMSKGVDVTYVTGNHDEMLRKFEGFELGSLRIVNKVSLDLDGKKAWIFHGDVFDVTMQHSAWIARLGAIGYDLLILINSFVNYISEKMGRGRISLSKKVKNSVKSAVKFINHFEQMVTDLAAENDYAYVVCGHIHHPAKEIYQTDNGDVMYLNSGDWIENLTALEYHEGEWSVYSYQEEVFEHEEEEKEELAGLEDQTPKELFGNLLKEFQLT